MITQFIKVIKNIHFRKLTTTIGYCPVCLARRPLVRLYNHEMGIRCLTCRSSSVTMSLVSVLHQLIGDLADKDVYELSSRGPLVSHLKKHCGKLTCSEYFEEIPSGDCHRGVLCQDVQHLTFSSDSFDICTSTEVFEHVPNDLLGFAEIKRVLRPGGLFLFTVPLSNTPSTVERARLDESGCVEHILSPQYHGDPIRGHQPILVFRDYGMDIKKRLLAQGFSCVDLLSPTHLLPWGVHRKVIAAYN